jgi:hypothetical protein
MILTYPKTVLPRGYATSIAIVYKEWTIHPVKANDSRYNRDSARGTGMCRMSKSDASLLPDTLSLSFN